MKIEEQLVENIQRININRLDQSILDYAKIRITDTIGAILGATYSSGVDMTLDLVKQWGGNRESTILGIGEKVPAANAVLVMGIAARSNDMDPAGGPNINGSKSPGHYSATSVPTAIGMAEKLGLSGRDLLAALIAGDDTASRIGTAGAGPWDLGWDPSATCSRFGATVVAGKLLGLNSEQMLNALGIVLAQIGGTMLSVMAYTHSFKIGQGLAGWNGIVSAELAKRGFTGPKDFLFGEFGYYQQYCREVKPEIITAELGEKYYADEEFKVYPCCRGNAAPVETALQLANNNELDVENISSIYVDLSPMWQGSFLVQPFEIGPCPQASAILNLRYNVASALLRKEAKLDNYTDESISDRKVAELVNKIQINPTVPGKRMSCRIRVITENGRELSASTGEPKGDYRVLPLSKEDIRAKFIDNVKFSKVITVAQAEKALGILDDLEKVENLTELIGNLTPVPEN